MTFKDLLKEKLKDKLDEDKIDKLPSGFQRIGDIVILNLDERLKKYENIIGKDVLELLKVRSVCNKIGNIKGKFRKPQIKVIAGSKDTITTHIESGCKYRFDVKKIMFAKGNVFERTRIAKQVKKSEVIVDMFAGIGYFSVPIGVLAKPKKIYAIELNPVSFKFLQENLKINHINCVESINEDCRGVAENLSKQGIKADRIIMGYLPPPWNFLDGAFKIAKKGTILHFEDIVRVGKENEDTDRVVNGIKKVAKENFEKTWKSKFSKKNFAQISSENKFSDTFKIKDFEVFGNRNYAKFSKENGFDIELLLAKRVKSYAPKTEHWVFDLRIV